MQSHQHILVKGYLPFLLHLKYVATNREHFKTREFYFDLQISNKKITMIRDAIPMIRDAIPMIRDTIPMIRSVLTKCSTIYTLIIS